MFPQTWDAICLSGFEIQRLYGKTLIGMTALKACLSVAFLQIWTRGLKEDTKWVIVLAQGNRMLRVMVLGSRFKSSSIGRIDNRVATVYIVMSRKAFFSLLKSVACCELWVASKIFLLFLRIAKKVKMWPPIGIAINDMSVMFSIAS